jgi:enolase-phosphatase E1
VTRAEWNSVRVVLLDIEGTTTPIDFVYKTLFPYVSAHVESFLTAQSVEPEIRGIVKELKADHANSVAAGLAAPNWPADSKDELRDCAAYVRWLIERDSKYTPLKSLQGQIWQRGFESGELHGEVYPDVPRAFARWRRQGREIAIYSSGSVLAQKLLFGSVQSGDLTPHIRDYFDTGVGVKAAAPSYTKIAAAIEKQPREFLFLSDAPKEVEAARSAGMFVALCDRERQPTHENPTDTISTFDEVLPD